VTARRLRPAVVFRLTRLPFALVLPFAPPPRPSRGKPLPRLRTPSPARPGSSPVPTWTSTLFQRSWPAWGADERYRVANRRYAEMNGRSPAEVDGA
jgi:hypothetical protein